MIRPQNKSRKLYSTRTFSYISISITQTSNQVQVQEIMSEAPADRLQGPYLFTLYLTTSEHLKLYNKAIFWLAESNRYALTKSNWTELYQELEDTVLTFVFKALVLVVKIRDGFHIPTEFTNVISFYPSITQAMVDSHCENMWANNSGEGLGRHPPTIH